MIRRSSGILLHLTSLPSPFGIGDLGPQAYRFADFLAAAGQSTWQILPLTPTSVPTYNDPYHSVSAFAGNPLLLSPEFMVQDGWLEEDDIASPPDFPVDRVDFEAVTHYKTGLFRKAHEAFDPAREPDYVPFLTANAHWLDDYALYVALQGRFGGASWRQWPQAIRDRDPDALPQIRRDLADDISRITFLQYAFHHQWQSLRDYCTERTIQIFGDMPIYVDLDSADVWANPALWKLDEDLEPTVVAGVPPDYFSATGQLWESPIYDWQAHQQEGFAWWLARIHRNLDLFDRLRIDHFRGLVAYWEVPAGETTAMNGAWVEAPVIALLDALFASRPCLPLVAEDLGVITPDVRETMARYDLPGMKILLFAFGNDLPTNPYAPHNIDAHALVYTGTHDNNPALAWYDEEADQQTRDRLDQYLGRPVETKTLHWDLMRMASQTRAALAVFPMQDVLGLGAQARMNRPGNLQGNWHWRMAPGMTTKELAVTLRTMAKLHGRT